MANVAVSLHVQPPIGPEMGSCPRPFTEQADVDVGNVEILDLSDEFEAALDQTDDVVLSGRNVTQRALEVVALDVFGQCDNRRSDSLAIGHDQFVSEIAGDEAGSAEETGDEKGCLSSLRPLPHARDREHAQDDHRGPGTLGEPHTVTSHGWRSAE